MSLQRFLGTRARYAAIAAAALIAAIVVVAALVIVLLGGDGEEESRAGGLLWLDGEWVTGHFDIEAAGLTLRINGRVVRDRTPVAVTPADRTDPPVDAIDAVAAAHAWLVDAGVTITETLPPDGTLADLRRYLDGLAAVAETRLEPPALVITDRDGTSAMLLLQVRGPATEAERRAEVQAIADHWRGTLEDGGVLVLEAGVALTVPATAGGAFTAALAEALAAPPAGRAERLLDVLGSRALAETLADEATPPPSAHRRDEAPPRTARPATDAVRVTEAAGALVSARAGSAPPRQAPGSQGNHGDYRTPAANRAYLITTATAEGIGCPADPIRQAADLHGYSIVEVDGTAATISEFLASSGRAGLLYACYHGGNAIEFHDNEAAARAALAAYNAAGLQGLQLGSHDASRWYVTAPNAFVAANWRSANTIVEMEACGGGNASPGFNAREFIGTFNLCYPSAAATVGWAREFWGRLDGTKRNGLVRNVGDAFAQAYAGSGYQLSGTGNGNTVLVPAVTSFEPEVLVPVSPATALEGVIRFDAQMDQTISLGRILELSGDCDAELLSEEWRGPYTYAFKYVTKKPGPLTFTVSATWATSSDDLGLHLDGNVDPDGTDHVGPSFDNWETTVECVLTVTPTPVSETATPVGVTPPLATATGTPAGVTPPLTTATATATATPGAAGVEVGALGVGVDHPPFEENYLVEGASVALACGYIFGVPGGSAVFMTVEGGGAETQAIAVLDGDGFFLTPIGIFAYGPFAWSIDRVETLDGQVFTDVSGGASLEIGPEEQSCEPTP